MDPAQVGRKAEVIITDDVVADFQKDGVVVLRGVFADWVDTLAEGVAEVMKHPSPLERSYQPKDGSAAFFQDYCNWARIPALRAIRASAFGLPWTRYHGP
jgi:hypothetical protein